MGLLDVVNIKDQVVGEADYTEVHLRGLRHRSVNLWIVDVNGNLAVAERSGQQQVSAHKYHVSAGGHNRLGQDYLPAARDQLQDELFHGERLPQDLIIEEIARYPNDTRDTNKENTTLYVVRWSGPFNLNPEETSQVLWLPPLDIIAGIDEFPQRYTTTCKNAFDKYLDWLGTS